MPHNLIERDSFIKHDARRRAIVLFDPGAFHELLDPFEQLISPWLPCQGIVTQASDGVVVTHGTLGRHLAVVFAAKGTSRDGSVGEVSGAKIADALELTVEDNRDGIPTRAVVVFETGGVRLQETNPGLTAITEIHAGIRALRECGLVVGITAGVVGCFGDMSIVAGLCSYLLMTRGARLDLNGPQTIEQEADIEEYDSRDRLSIRSLTGSGQRAATGSADVCTEDSPVTIHMQMIEQLCVGAPARQHGEQIDHYLVQLAAVDTSCQATAEDMRARYAKDAV